MIAPSPRMIRRAVLNKIELPRSLRLSSAERCNKSSKRRGVAAVEVALCLPILILVTLLFIEFTNLIFLRQSLKVASYEGIRVAIKEGADLTDVTSICTEILDSREVVDYEIFVDPADFTTIPRGTLTTVTIEVDKGNNQLFGLLLGGGAVIEVQGFGLKE